MNMIKWMYANRFGELQHGQAEIVEALVQIAEQLDRLATLQDNIQSQKESRETWAIKDD